MNEDKTEESTEDYESIQKGEAIAEALQKALKISEFEAKSLEAYADQLRYELDSSLKRTTAVDNADGSRTYKIELRFGKQSIFKTLTVSQTEEDGES